MRKVLTFLVFVYFLGFSNYALSKANIPDVSVVTVWGEAPITSSPELDKKNAIAQARRLAVEQVVGVYVAANTLVNNFQVVNDKIYSQAAGFISNFKILKEERKNMHRVQIEAQVGIAPITDILQASGLLREWKIGILMAADHKNPPKLSDMSGNSVIEFIRSIESTIGEQLVKAQFKVVDPRQLEKIRRQFEQSDNVDAAVVSGMDILITGDVTIATRQSMGTIHQASCQIHSKILRADTGEIVYEGNIGNTFDGSTLIVDKRIASKYANTLGNGVLSDGTPDLRAFGGGTAAAVEKAIRISASIASDIIVSQVSKLPSSVSSKIALEIRGLSFEDAASLEEKLKAIQGVANVIMEGYSGNTQNIDIDYDSDANSFARVLSKTDFFKKFKLKIAQVSKNKITLKRN